MKHSISRLAIGSPLTRPPGIIVLGTILTAALVLSSSQLIAWASGYPLPMLVGMIAGVGFYVPSIIAIWFLDRREREPLLLFLVVILAVILIFAPIAGQVNDVLRQRLPLFAFVGLNEEFWKAAPVILLAVFIPRSMNGVRDGLIFGSISGLAFAVVEFGYYVAYVGFEDVGWTSLINQFARGNFLGTHNHIIWTATVGAAIGWASVSHIGWKSIGIPVLAYLGVAATHSLQDGGGNVVATMVGGAMLEPMLLMAPDPEATLNAWMTPIQMYFGTVDILLINAIVLPILFVALRRSGDYERKIICEQLSFEAADIVTAKEYDGVLADKRLGIRKISGMDGRQSRELVQLQNEIAFQRAYAIRRGENPDKDPCVLDLRRLVRSFRETCV